MEILDIEEVQTAPKTELEPIERAAIALESTKTEQHLMALATKHQSITVVKDKAGREQAHGAYIEVMRARTAVEKAAKDAREDATKFSKAVIAEAARLVAIVEPEEARLKEARDAWDAEQARIKAEAEARESARVLAITERIAAIKAYVVMANNCRTSARVVELQVKLCDTEMTGFEEFEAEALMALADTEAHLNRVLANIREQEDEAARIKAEQEAEAARLKAEREELDRQRAEAAAQAKAQAEAKRVADEARAQAEAAEAKVRAAAEAMAAERAELDRMRAEFERQKAEETLAKAAKAAEAFVVPPVAETDKPTPGIFSEMTVAEVSERITVEAEQHTYTVMPPEPAFAEVPRAPVASAIVLAVAEFWHTDTKTAARWITERASEIATLKG